MGSEVPLSGQLLDRIWFYVNFDCNLRCSFCVADAGPRSLRPRIPLDQFRTLSDQAFSAGFRELVITGGEPLLHPDIEGILRQATSLLPTTLLTNATLVTPRTLGFLSSMGERLAVQVSLDSSEPSTHDAHRGMGSWQAAMRGAVDLLQAGIRLSVRITVVDQQPDDLERLKRLLAEMGIPEERVLVAQVASGGRSTGGLRMALPELLAEPTVARDGLYLHPLKVHPSEAVAANPIPLALALAALAEQLATFPPPAHGARRYR